MSGKDFLRRKIPCQHCGTLTEMLWTKLCDRCYEVNRNLPIYLFNINEEQFQFVLRYVDEIHEARKRRSQILHARQFGKTKDTGIQDGVQLSRNGWSKEAHKLAEEFCGIRSVRRPWWKFWQRMD